MRESVRAGKLCLSSCRCWGGWLDLEHSGAGVGESSVPLVT